MSVEFFVPGVPVPQGSKTGFVVGKRAVVVDANASVLKPWRATIAQAAHELQVRFEGPVFVVAEFRFVRPKSVSVKRRPFPDVKPDGDKLARSLLDGLTDGGLVRDDAQVVDLVARKRYAPASGVWVQVGPMGEDREAGA